MVNIKDLFLPVISWRIIRCDLVKLRTVSFRGGCVGGRGKGRKEGLGHMWSSGSEGINSDLRCIASKIVMK